MRTARGLMVVCAGIGVFALALHAGVARANDFSTERPGSILIFPKVVSVNKLDSTGPQHDTIIQITNTSNVPQTVHCYYVDGSPENPYLPADPELNPPRCTVVDFELNLTRQQPTSWSVSNGRSVDPSDAQAGLDPGLVPPMRTGFTGELVCVEVDDSGYPIAANALKGEATIGEMLAGDVTKYNGITVEGIDPGADLDLELDGVEYAACPAGLLVNFQAEDEGDMVIDALGGGVGSSVVNTNLTLVPCSVDLENLTLKSVTVAFETVNEFENHFSASTEVSCWNSLSLGDPDILGAFGNLGSAYGTARLTPVDGDVGVIGIGSTRRIHRTGAQGTSAYNLHVEGNNPSTNDGAVIRIRNL